MKILIDFFPIILFFLVYKLHDIYAATAAAVAASLLQVAWLWYRHRRVETMNLVTLGLLVVFGGLTIVLQDRVFIMWKPSIVNWLFAILFLGSQFVGERPLIERMMGHAVSIPMRVWRRLNLIWAAFFVFLGLANLYVAQRFFVAERALGLASGEKDIDLAACAQLFSGHVLDLCTVAHNREETWVNFKLFGMMGLTIAFVVAQGFYLARHIEDAEPKREAD